MLPDDLSDDAFAFLAERHLATLTTLRADGSPHVVAVGFTYDPDQRLVRVITAASSVKAANAARGGRAVVAQVDGPRWVALEGTVTASVDPTRVRAAVDAYAERYRAPRERTDRVVVEITVDRVQGSSRMRRP
jgi:PPOX class probable F420-dependent enzyme